MKIAEYSAIWQACMQTAEIMPKKQTDPIRTRLAVEDRYKFEQICRAEGKTETELARRAILQFIDSYDKKADDNARDRLADVLEAMQAAQKKDTERLAKLAARTLIDVGTIQQVFYKRASEKDRDDLWDEARRRALERLRKKRKGGDPEATEIVQDAISS
jgi:hypothetical protein